MKKNKLNPENIESISVLFEFTIEELEENEIYYDEEALIDIMAEGAIAVTWYVDIEFENLPKNLVVFCDNLHDEVWNSFDEIEQVYEFIVDFIDEYYQ